MRALLGIMLSYHKRMRWHGLKWEEEDSLIIQGPRFKLEAGLGRIR